MKSKMVKVKNEKITWEEKGDRVIGTIAMDEETANIDIPVELQSEFKKNALEILSAFSHAVRANRPLQIGSFGFWLDDEGWHFTSWDEVDEIQKILSFMFDEVSER